MRIIAGRYKGRKIKLPKGIRPTQDKVREALFDILGSIEGLSFLELFAGSGAVGLEALSRGAGEALFVEKDPVCLNALKENLLLVASSACQVLPLDASRVIKRLASQGKSFNLVFMDPPYHKDRVRPAQEIAESLAKKALQTLGAYDILAPNGFIIVQHFKKDILPQETGVLGRFKEARYGDTTLSFYKKIASGR